MVDYKVVDIDKLFTLEKQGWPQIVLKQHDITKIRVDAIVNAANGALLGGGGIDGVIHRAAGKKLEDYCRNLNGCETGNAKFTPGFDIRHIKGIIHTVGPNLAGRGVEGPTEDDEKQLSSCYKRCLDVALKEGMNSIAFCSISTGLYCYNLDKATAVAFRTVQTWLTENSSIKMKIVFCTFAHPDTNAYEKELGISKYLTNEVNGFNSRK